MPTSLPADTVLLTRPDPDSRRVARQLAADGIATAIWPLTRIVATTGPIPVPPGTGGLIFTSQNAVAAFAGISAERTLCAWCVGDRTAGAARAAGFTNVVSAGGTVDDLADLLAAAPPSRLLYLRGRHVSADLAAQLRRYGHRIQSAVVYGAEATGPPPADIAAGLRSGAIETVALWSRRAAAVLADQAALNPDWPLARMRVVVISARAAEPLTACGFAGVSIAPTPDGPGMLAAIRAAVRQ